jgi:hypothetical protein
MTLLADLDAFNLDHRRCGELDASVDGDIVWMACDCGAGSPAVLTKATHLT